MNVLCIMKDGFEELEAVGTIALLRRAGIDVDVCTSDANKVSGRFNLTLQPVKDLKEVDPTSYDALFLPGGPHYQTLESDAYIMEILSSYIHSDKVVAAICAAPMMLGKLGLLKGRKATCYPGFEQYLEGAECTGAPVERDGNIITGKGPGAAMEFALTVVDMMLGKEKVQELKEAMCVI